MKIENKVVCIFVRFKKEKVSYCNAFKEKNKLVYFPVVLCKKLCFILFFPKKCIIASANCVMLEEAITFYDH